MNDFFAWPLKDQIQFIAALIAIAVFMRSVFKSMWKLLKFFATRRETTARLDEELERQRQETERLEAAGKTVSAWTDLGFFVLMELGTLREALDSERYTSLLSALLTVAILFIFFEVASLDSLFAQALPPLLRVVLLVAPFLALVAFGLEHYSVKKQESYILNYQERIKAIWREPIGKRTQKAQE